jgi:hypothetical protein
VASRKLPRDNNSTDEEDEQEKLNNGNSRTSFNIEFSELRFLHLDSSPSPNTN